MTLQANLEDGVYKAILKTEKIYYLWGERKRPSLKLEKVKLEYFHALQAYSSDKLLPSIARFPFHLIVQMYKVIIIN